MLGDLDFIEISDATGLDLMIGGMESLVEKHDIFYGSHNFRSFYSV